MAPASGCLGRGVFHAFACGHFAPPVCQEISPPIVEKTPRGRILIVEDNVVNQLVAVKLVQRLGYTTDSAVNGQEALDRIAETDYLLILMDCQMPVMSGIEATREIRKRENGRRTTIAALTARATKEDEAQYLEAGMDSFLSKPIDSKKFAEVLAKWDDQPVRDPRLVPF